jgi:hypothetical protein
MAFLLHSLNVGRLFGSLSSTLIVRKFRDSRGKVFSVRVDSHQVIADCSMRIVVP